LNIILDTGSTHTIVPISYLKYLHINEELKHRTLRLKQTCGFIDFNKFLNIKLTIGKITNDINVLILDEKLPYILLSLEHIRLFKFQIDFSNFKITQFNVPINSNFYNNSSFSYFISNDNNYDNIQNVCQNSNLTQNVFNNSNVRQFPNLHNACANEYFDLNNVKLEDHYSTFEKQKIINTISKNKLSFAMHEFDIGNIRLEPIRIRLNSELPISLKPYRASYTDNEKINKQITNLLKYNIISPSYSPYSSPVTLVNKKDQKRSRMVVDYRRLNTVTVTDSEPIPNIQDLLDQLSEATIFSTLDLISGYHHLEIHPDDREKTAFTTKYGLFQYNRLPFGLRNAPAQFQRIIKQILNKYKINFALNYFDDIIIYSKNLNEHLDHLQKFLEICTKENIKLKLNKCNFAKTTISFLGYDISHKQITPSFSNIEAIKKLIIPKNKKQLQSFLGSINVYNRFIHNYSRIRNPLNKLLKKNSQYLWTDECQKAFQTLKDVLISHPILKLYNHNYKCHLFVDASQLGLGAVLKQEHPDGNLYPISFHSRTLRPYEENYSITELECLAIIDSIDKYSYYLHGNKFTIHTDHAALCWIAKIKSPKGRLFRWSLKLSMYDYEVKYQKGKTNYEADMLSRNPITHFLSPIELADHQNLDNINNKKYVKYNNVLTIKKRGLIKSVVPPSLREKLLKLAHENSGHSGVSKIIKLISPLYYWPGIIQDISNYVKHCEICQLNKKSKQKKFGLMQSLPPAEDPFDLISIDTIGGLQHYGSTKKYIHLVVDHATRYIWTFASKSCTTDSYINCLNKVFQIQKPKKFLSDRAASFTSPRFKRYLVNNNVKQLLTSSSHPQGNGLNERSNQTIIVRLRCRYNNLKNKNPVWTKLLEEVTADYNNTPHNVTGFTPAYLLYGKLPYSSPLEQTQLYPSIEIAREQAFNNSVIAHNKSKIRYDKRFQESPFEVGDIVLLENFYHPDNRKLQSPNIGPYTIVNKISSVAFEIDKPQQNLNKNTTVVHSTKLRKFHSSKDFQFKKPNSKIPIRDNSPNIGQTKTKVIYSKIPCLVNPKNDQNLQTIPKRI